MGGINLPPFFERYKMKLKYKDSINLKELEFNKEDILTIITSIHLNILKRELSLNDNRTDILNQLNELIGIDTDTVISIMKNAKRLVKM